MDELKGSSSTSPVHIEFETFISPVNKLTTNTSRFQQSSPPITGQLITHAVPAIQTQLSSRYKETEERLKEIKEERLMLLKSVNKTPTKHYRQHEDQQQ